MGTTKSVNPWKINLNKFRIYLRNKYSVSTAYYFLGYVHDKNKELYREIEESGFVLIFKQHSSAMLGKKKGNVDSDIVFQIMKKLYKNKINDKIVLISGDGDYKMLVEFLIKENKFKTILFPNRQYASSLYKKMGSDYFVYLDDEDIKKKTSFI